MIFGQSTEPPPKFSIFRGWLGRILKYFRLWLNSYFSWLDWQSFEILWVWSCLECGLRECTVKPFEAIKNDRGECLDTQSRSPWCPELVVSVLLNREKTVVCLCQCTIELIAEAKTECKSCRRRGHVTSETQSSFEVETRLWTVDGNAALTHQERRANDKPRLHCVTIETRLWPLRRRGSETQTCVLQFDKGDAAFRFAKGHRLQNATLNCYAT